MRVEAKSAGVFEHLADAGSSSLPFWNQDWTTSQYGDQTMAPAGQNEEQITSSGTESRNLDDDGGHMTHLSQLLGIRIALQEMKAH